MIDVEKMSQRVKLVAENAELLFQMAKVKFQENFEAANTSEEPSADPMNESSSVTFKDRVSSTFQKTVNNRFKDTEQLLQMADQFVTQFVDPLIADYLKRHISFQGNVEVKLKTLENFKGAIPQYESLGASGLDVRAQLDAPIVIKPFERVLVPTGLSMEVPKAYEIQARPRSGLSLKKGLTLVNTPGTIDADYRGEIKMIMINLGQTDVIIEDQERIAQLVICPVVKADIVLVDDLSNTDRGESGFGSTGSK